MTGEHSDLGVSDAEIELSPSEARLRTIQTQALRRLSKTEVAGLGIGLSAITELESVLIVEMGNMRAAAEKEAAVRKLKGLPGPGPFARAHAAVRRSLCAVGLAIEDTGEAIDSGKVAEQPDDGPHSRACGIRKHDHGRDCHANCPTCGSAPGKVALR